jgi:hypothetical protein
MARVSPSASPVPIMALPISFITARTSAKSRLMRPGRTIRSVTPLTPWYSTSSAIAKASVKVVFSLASRNRFWFGMMMSVSTTFCSASIPSFGLAHAFRAFELEGFRDDTDGQDAKLARGLRDDRRGPRAGAAAHARGDEGHVRAGEVIDDLLDRFLRRACADGGPRARAQPLGHPRAHLDAALRRGLRERLRVGVRNHELAALEVLGNHVVDGIAAGSAHAENGDTRFEVLPRLGHGEIECHRFGPPVVRVVRFS